MPVTGKMNHRKKLSSRPSKLFCRLFAQIKAGQYEGDQECKRCLQNYDSGEVTTDTFPTNTIFHLLCALEVRLSLSLSPALSEFSFK